MTARLPMRTSPPCLVFASLCFVAHLGADVMPAAPFADNAVLQRGKTIPVWGTADAGENVTVTFAGQTATAVADDSGRWSVQLDPLPAIATPGELVIRGNNTVTLTNIVVGDVWLASGQSNMKWSVRNTYDQAIDIPASANLPLIRELHIAEKASDDPLATASGRWRVAGPDTTGKFSAVGYYFARDLHSVLNVPIGIINSGWGGTRIEAWMDADTLAAQPQSAPVLKHWAGELAKYPERKAEHDRAVAEWARAKAAAEAAGEAFTQKYPSRPHGPGHPSTPSGLYNGMIHPVVPYALSGFIWYQGEANIGKHDAYRAFFPAMITGWRDRFAQGDLPFYWVQLANYYSATGTEWAFLREAQTHTLALPATGQAVIIDLGDFNDIHPRNKKDVGRRLARLALARTYGQTIIDSGPVFQKAEREGDGFRVTFTLPGGSNLRAPLNELGGFELAGEDKVFHAASAKIDGKGVVLVTSTEVPEPVAVRYAWRDAPLAGLFNNEGLPAVPFRSDNW